MHFPLLIILAVVVSTALALPIPDASITDKLIIDPATGVSFPKGWYLRIIGLPLLASVADTDAEMKEKDGMKAERKEEA
jgi:hypothetical protein